MFNWSADSSIRLTGQQILLDSTIRLTGQQILLYV
jgi:hypothetical protein